MKVMVFIEIGDLLKSRKSLKWFVRQIYQKYDLIE